MLVLATLLAFVQENVKKKNTKKSNLFHKEWLGLKPPVTSCLVLISNRFPSVFATNGIGRKLFY